MEIILFFFTLYFMQNSIHESESSETPEIENSQGVAENTTETEVESTVTQTPAGFKRLKKADEDTLLKQMRIHY